MCGGAGTEQAYNVELMVPHNSPSVNVIFTSTLAAEASAVASYLNAIVLFRNLGD